MTTPHIETARLILRPPTMEDFPRWADFQADPEATRFIGGPKSPSEAWRILATVAGAWALTGEGFFSVIKKSSGLWVGRIGPWRPHGWPGAEVGWSLHRDAHGKGYAVEAAIASIDYAFDVLGWEDVVHTIEMENQASIRVAERLGSKYRGPARLPEPFSDTPAHLWGQTRGEWRINRAALAPGT